MLALLVALVFCLGLAGALAKAKRHNVWAWSALKLALPPSAVILAQWPDKGRWCRTPSLGSWIVRGAVVVLVIYMGMQISGHARLQSRPSGWWLDAVEQVANLLGADAYHTGPRFTVGSHGVEGMAELMLGEAAGPYGSVIQLTAAGLVLGLLVFRRQPWVALGMGLCGMVVGAGSYILRTGMLIAAYAEGRATAARAHHFGAGIGTVASSYLLLWLLALALAWAFAPEAVEREAGDQAVRSRTRKGLVAVAAGIILCPIGIHLIVGHTQLGRALAGEVMWRIALATSEDDQELEDACIARFVALTEPMAAGDIPVMALPERLGAYRLVTRMEPLPPRVLRETRIVAMETAVYETVSGEQWRVSIRYLSADGPLPLRPEMVIAGMQEQGTIDVPASAGTHPVRHIRYSPSVTEQAFDIFVAKWLNGRWPSDRRDWRQWISENRGTDGYICMVDFMRLAAGRGTPSLDVVPIAEPMIEAVDRSTRRD